MTVRDTTWRTQHGDEVTVFHTDSGWRWHVKAANGEIVGQGEAHPRFGDAMRAAQRHHPVEGGAA
jgi:hypothetical protein